MRWQVKQEGIPIARFLMESDARQYVEYLRNTWSLSYSVERVSNADTQQNP